ncbi:MAG: ATP-binding cassette domain-containing protein, partial [Synechococcaceae bacterium WB5_2B_268]|nr:ATP-binding cassette domain-containing protein [Synechococcaceae bacterium WB5_2B_268]
DSGAIHLDGTALGSLSQAARVKRGLARTFQVPQVLGEYTARDNVVAALYARGASSDEADQHLVRAAMSARAGVRVSDLSHGERKQLELAIALATRPRMLLLDEPMAGLGPVESTQMISILQGLHNRCATCNRFSTAFKNCPVTRSNRKGCNLNNSIGSSFKYHP